MKMKKYIGGLLGACALTVFAGCYEPLDLTDSEMDMVAEYAASVLVEHGTKTTETLLDRKEQEDAWAALATPTPRPPIPQIKEEETKDDTDKKEDGPTQTVTTPEAKPTPTAVPDNTKQTMQDLSKLMGNGKFEFDYTGFESTVFYQGAGGLFTAAEDGKQLVVLQFDVKNTAGKEAKLVLNKGKDKALTYTLRVGNKSIRPSLTLLEEDFCTSYEVSYKAGETKKCVLVFECSKELALDNMVLTVLKESEGKEDSVLVKIK
ncbi:MAG: hypothetical protein IJZ55_02075 [Lachnospiraceae bacterium]|nr:hypothetical protein [Lachnospiraceae bacterium]